MVLGGSRPTQAEVATPHMLRVRDVGGRIMPEEQKDVQAEHRRSSILVAGTYPPLTTNSTPDPLHQLSPKTLDAQK